MAENNICKHYQQNKCFKGDRCKFKHINQIVDISHLTGVENPITKKSKELQSSQTAKLSEITSGLEHRLPKNDREREMLNRLNPCKDFINGRCSRANNCKFSHEQPQEYGLDEGRGWNLGDRGYGPPDRKRRIMDDGYGQQDPWMRGGGGMGMHGMGMGGGMNMLPTPDDYSRLQRENEQLKIENSDLRREMDGLKATVKVLLDETANMRQEAKTEGSNGTNKPGGYGMGGSGNRGMAHQHNQGSQSYGRW